MVSAATLRIPRPVKIGVQNTPTGSSDPAALGDGDPKSTDFGPVSMAIRLCGTAHWFDPTGHVIVFNERHLRHLLSAYQRYYNEARTHLSLMKDAPPREVQGVGHWRSSADYTTNMFVFEFPTRTAV
jgi:hypothetical protein